MMRGVRAPPDFGQLLRDFFSVHLTTQRGASARTVEAYRDAFRLFFAYAERELGKRPVELELNDFDAPILLRFLDWLEETRGNGVRTRNVRLAALKSFLNYAASHSPTSLTVLKRALSVPSKRCEKPLLGFLSREEVNAVLAQPRRGTWAGERDYVLFSTAYNTGARVSELVHLTVGDVELERGRCIRIIGKGRKLRNVPLWKSTAHALRMWVRYSGLGKASAIFPNRHGQPMTRSNVEKRLKAAVESAAETCPSLAGRRISPHTLRHTTAMHLLQSGIDLSTIALWLGHASPASTHAYIEADLTMKERVLAKLAAPHARSWRFRPTDRLLAFLESL